MEEGKINPEIIATKFYQQANIKQEINKQKVHSTLLNVSLYCTKEPYQTAG
jgi:hypothetical protein